MSGDAVSRFFDAVTFGPMRRRRSLDRQFRQLSDAYRSGAPLGGPQPSRPARRPAPGGFGAPSTPPSPGFGRLLLVLVVIAGLVGGLLFAARSFNSTSPSDGRAGPLDSYSPVPVEPSAAQPGSPPAGVGSAPERLLPAVTPPAGSGGYTFTATTPTGPVSWDPCRPLTVVTRSAPGEPASGDRLVQQALDAARQATGLQITTEGKTDEAPSMKRPQYQPQRYGQRWAPVLVAWSDPKESPELAGRVLGVGGPVRVESTRSDAAPVVGYVSGSVTLDGPEITELIRTRGADAGRAVIEHEIGHVLGLNHVPDKGQLMFSETEVGVTSYQAGDRRGLAQLGAGPCLPSL